MGESTYTTVLAFELFGSNKEGANLEKPPPVLGAQGPAAGQKAVGPCVTTPELNKSLAQYLV